jgi:hypothetical protein
MADDHAVPAVDGDAPAAQRPSSPAVPPTAAANNTSNDVPAAPTPAAAPAVAATTTAGAPGAAGAAAAAVATVHKPADDGYRTATVDGVAKRWRLEDFELLETLGTQ